MSKCLPGSPGQPLFFCVPPPPPTGVIVPLAEDGLIFVEDELHNLVLEHHVHGDVGRLHLRPQQGGPEHDGHVLHRHPVVVSVFDDPEEGRG